MALNRAIYEYYRKKILLQMIKEEGLLQDSEEVKILKEIKGQTSDTKGILQNVAGNFISDGVIYLIKKLIR